MLAHSQHRHGSRLAVAFGGLLVAGVVASCASTPTAFVDPARADAALAALDETCQYVDGELLGNLEGDAVQMWYCADATLTVRSVPRSVPHADLAAGLERELATQGAGQSRVDRSEDGFTANGETLARTSLTLVARGGSRRWDVPTALAVILTAPRGDHRAVFTCAAPVLGGRDELLNGAALCDDALRALIDSSPD